MWHIDKELQEARETTAASLNSPPPSYSKGNVSNNDMTSGSFMRPMYDQTSRGSGMESKSIRENNRYEDSVKSEATLRDQLFYSEVEFIGYLDQYKPVNLGVLSSSQIINYHHFMESKIKKALMPVYYNKF
jgi:hypothetical protein